MRFFLLLLAGVFSLVYDSFFRKVDTVDDFYSRVPRDGFLKWKNEKLQETHVGMLKYLRGDPKKYGIIVDPRLSSKSDSGHMLHWYKDINYLRCSAITSFSC